MRPLCVLSILLFLVVIEPGGLLGQEINAGKPRSIDAKTASDKPEAKPKYRYWTTQWSFEDIDVKELASKLKAIGVELPVELSGRVSVNFDVSIPFMAVRTAEAYRFNGSLKARQLMVEDVSFEKLDASVNYQEGVITLSDLSGKQSARENRTSGVISGSAKAALIPRDSFGASIEFSEFDIEPITRLLAKFGIGSKSRPIRGIISGDFDAIGKLDLIDQPQKWEANGTLQLDQLSVGDSLTYAATVDAFKLKDQHLQTNGIEMNSPSIPSFFLKAKADLYLDASRSFQLLMATNDLPLTDLLGLYFETAESIADGKLDLQATVTGKFVDGNEFPELDARLRIASPQMRVGGIDLGLIEHDIRATDKRLSITPTANVSLEQADRLTIERMSADYDLTEDRFLLQKVDLKAFAGTMKASGELSRKETGNHALSAKWSEIRPQFSVGALLGTRDVLMSASTSGQIEWTAPASEFEIPSSHRLTANASLSQVRLGAQSVGAAEAQLSIDKAGMRVSADATVLGGRVLIKTVAPIPQTATWSDVPATALGELKIEKVSLGHLARVVSGQKTRFAGRLGGSIRFERCADGTLSSQSSLRLQRLAAGKTLVARDVALRFESSGKEITIRSIRGAYAGGQIEASGQWSLTSGKRLITARLVHAEGEKILLPINENADSWVGGQVSGRATIVGTGRNPLESIRVSGALHVDQATTFGLPVGNARGPFFVSFTPSPMRWTAEFPSLRASLAGGRVDGHLRFSSTVASTKGFDMESGWRANHVDFEQLLSTYAGTSTIGHGNVSGDFALGGRNIRGVNDLKGEYRVKLGGSDATAVPGLSTAGSLLGATSLVGVRFSDGQSSGRITRGSVVIDQLALASDRAAFQASGRIAIFDKRLDIRAVLSTGNFQGQSVLISQIGAQALLNYSPIGQINRIVSDRTVVFELAGPVRDPIIRLLPAETLQANAKRYLVQEALGLIAIDALLLD